MSFFISSAQAQAAGAATPQDQWFSMGFLVLLFAVFYFIAIRPQRKRQKEHVAMVSNLQKGDEVVTTSGILGKVVRIEDDYVALKVADNTELKFQKMAVHAVLPKGSLKAI
jgi:preprotein translocase subunit YajC